MMISRWCERLAAAVSSRRRTWKRRAAAAAAAGDKMMRRVFFCDGVLGVALIYGLILNGQAGSTEGSSASETFVAEIISFENIHIRLPRDLSLSDADAAAAASLANRTTNESITIADDDNDDDQSRQSPIVDGRTDTPIPKMTERSYSPFVSKDLGVPSAPTIVADGFPSHDTTVESPGTAAAAYGRISFNHSDVESSSSTSSQPLNSSTVSSFFPGENVTVIEDQNHVYYRSSITTGNADSFWADESVMFGMTEHASLSTSHRSAATIPLSFAFPFYGHEINQVTIATKGFLYMSDFLHQWLTATQYIAPMMANFETQLGNSSNVHYMDNGSAFIVWWQDLVISELRHMGPFNFQAALFVDGRIVFSYKKVPISLKEIPSNEHPVKVGISDAYYVDKPTNSNVKRRTIYEYHRIEINMTQIVSDVVVVITPLPTCRLMKTCEDCTASSLRLSFSCRWCPLLKRCSDGLDRQRQKWLETGCPNDRIQSASDCNSSSYFGVGDTKRWDGQLIYDDDDDDAHFNMTSSHVRSLALGPGVAGLVLIVAGVSILLYLLGWLIYAFSHPTSPSGRWLIEHRPSQLRMRMNHVKFFVRSENGTNNYLISMQQEVDAMA